MKKYMKVCPVCRNIFETYCKEQKCCKQCITKDYNQYPTIASDIE